MTATDADDDEDVVDGTGDEAEPGDEEEAETGEDGADGSTDVEATGDGGIEASVAAGTDDVAGDDPGATTDDPDPALVADGVTVHRGHRVILAGVSLSVDPGERVLIRGESGAGKTTLFSVLGLLDVPDGGTVRVGDEDAAALRERGRARIRREAVGVVYQEFRLVPDLTARENAALPQEHAGDRDEAWLDELFDRLGIAEQADQYPATLSGGEKQRVAIARALANRPDVVLADEPTGQLDPDRADAVMDLLFELGADTGAALVVVSHDPRLAGGFDRVLELVDGSLRERDDERDE